MEVLLRVVKQKTIAGFAIKWPDKSEMRLSAALLRHNRSHGVVLGCIFAVIDGGRMPCVTYDEPLHENSY